MLNNIQYSISLLGFDVSEKEKRRQLEDVLTDFKFSYWNVPESVPQDVVRMVGQTEHGHSFLRFSNNLAHLIINYDADYNSNIEKCMEYAHDKADKLTDALEKMSVSVAFSGVIAQYVYEDIKKPIECLTKKIVSVDVDKNSLYSVGAHIAMTYDDKYFINFGFSSLKMPSHQGNVLGVKVDINDKYGAKKEREKSALKDIFELEALQKKIDQKVIMRLLNEGKFDLHG